MLKGFRDFVARGNVVDLAVGVIIGAAFGGIVDSLVKDIITPLLGLVGGTPDFSALKLGPIGVGHFVNAVIAFALKAAGLAGLRGRDGGHNDVPELRREQSCARPGPPGSVNLGEEPSV